MICYHMAQMSNTKSIDDLTKRSISKKSDENYNTVKKKNCTMSFVERRKNVSGKSPPNPFMSRINISSFLDLIMSDKNDQSFSKNGKNPTNESFSLFVNSTRSTKDNAVASNTTGMSEQNNAQIMSNNCGSTSFADKICPVCANELPGLMLYRYCSCNHYSCIDCWQCYVISRIENYEIGYGFSCLTCTSEIPYHNILEIIKQTTDEEYSKKLISRLENFYLERALLRDVDFRRCPNRGCEYGVSVNPDFSSCPNLAKCMMKPGCSSQMCDECSIFWKLKASHSCKYQSHKYSDHEGNIFISILTGLHNSKSDIDKLGIPNSPPVLRNDPKRSNNQRNVLSCCFPWRNNKRSEDSKFRKLRSERSKSEKNNRSPSKMPMANQSDGEDIASLGSIKTTSSHTKFNYSTEPLQSEGEIKMCPKCHTYVLKMNDGSCNHMVCAVCGCEFCWLCMRQITDMHYLSPSGCTFWGRRQWNVEKRALWQMGTLIGAPLAIGFLAALAIPAMLIGIPLYVGRKIHGALKTKNKLRKRIIAVAGGIGAFIVSPVIVAVAVGLGVPLILAYVYIVMPIALCRSSACSCDENSPQQEEVDFSDVDNNNREQQIYDQGLGSPVSEYDSGSLVATHSRAEVTKQPEISPESSVGFLNQPVLPKFKYDIKLRNSILPISTKRIKSESSSMESLRNSQKKTDKIKIRYSDPLSNSMAGDENIDSL